MNYLTRILNVLQRKRRTLAHLLRESMVLCRALDNTGGLYLSLDLFLNRERVRQISINGEAVTLRSNSADVKVALSGLHEHEYDEFELDDARLIIDAGANIGITSIYFARRFPSATIIAIEPDSGNFALLIENTRTLKNVVPLQYALARSSGTMALVDRGTGYWGYTVKPETELSTGETVVDSVATRSLADIIAQFQIEKIDILKLDIEGGEKDVFDHSDMWIRRVRLILIETHDRIVSGCTESFRRACGQDFSISMSKGEKYIAIRRESASSND